MEHDMDSMDSMSEFEEVDGERRSQGSQPVYAAGARSPVAGSDSDSEANWDSEAGLEWGSKGSWDSSSESVSSVSSVSSPSSSSLSSLSLSSLSSSSSSSDQDEADVEECENEAADAHTEQSLHSRPTDEEMRTGVKRTTPTNAMEERDSKSRAQDRSPRYHSSRSIRHNSHHNHHHHHRKSGSLSRQLELIIASSVQNALLLKRTRHRE